MQNRINELEVYIMLNFLKRLTRTESKADNDEKSALLPEQTDNVETRQTTARWDLRTISSRFFSRRYMRLGGGGTENVCKSGSSVPWNSIVHSCLTAMLAFWPAMDA